jgi:chromate transporter
MEASARAEIAVETLHEHGISFGEAVRVWIRVALLSFGGPAGQIAVMHRILVEEALDRRAVPPRAQLLHAAARP